MGPELITGRGQIPDGAADEGVIPLYTENMILWLTRLGIFLLVISVPGILYFGFDFMFMRQYGFTGTLSLWLCFWSLGLFGFWLNRIAALQPSNR